MTATNSSARTRILVAIDIAKAKHDVLVELPTGKRRKMIVRNQLSDFRQLAAYLKRLEGTLEIALEPTADYHRNLAYFLKVQGFAVKLVSSIAVARTREALHKSWDKNDPKDAQVILHLLRNGNTQYSYDPVIEQTNDLQELSKTHFQVSLRDLLQAKYEGDILTQSSAAIRLDNGAFGLRLTGTAYRTLLDSEMRSPRDPFTPNLVVLHEMGVINLKELCGFEFPRGFWNRKRYKTLKKGLVVTGGGGGELDNPISEDELDEYISSRGVMGPKFIVLPMRDGVLDTKLRAAEDKGRQLGLMLSWNQQHRVVTEASHMVHNGFDTEQAANSLVDFLVRIIGRTDRTSNPPTSEQLAIAELCNPVVVGVFSFTDSIRGLAASLFASSCQERHNASGATFIDNMPDDIWKHVPIHELGHCFGLCHVDGIDRIMVSTRQNSALSWPRSNARLAQAPT